jgi:hypothetical protein
MTDTCGLTSCEPFAKWDRDSSCWKTSEATSLWALTLSSLTLPTWGGLHNGELCEHPTPELATSGLDYSSLPTPTKGDGEGGGKRVGVTWEDTTKSTAQGGASRLRDVAGLLATLPTPNHRDWKGAANPETKLAGGHQVNLNDVAAHLPTPTSRDRKGHNQRGDDSCLAGALLPTPTSQAAKHGETPDTTANGFGSNLWDLPHLLPTPRAQNGEPRNQNIYARPADQPQNLENALHGVITAPPSPDGSASSDDPHPHLLSLDVQGIPA